MDTFPAKIDLLGWLGRCLKLLRRWWPLVPALMGLFSCLMYLQARQNFVPQYEAAALISISSEEPLSGEGREPLAVTAFPEMLKTELMQDLIMARLGTDKLNGTLIPYRFQNTGLFQLVVSGTDPQEVCDILQAALEVYPQAMAHTVTTPKIEIRRAPLVPAAPCNVFDPGKTLARGALLGLALGLCLVGILALPGRIISGAWDLGDLSGLPLLGSIPQIPGGTCPDLQDNPALKAAFRELGTKLRAKGDPRVILLTSALPGEGCSTLARNLAQSLKAEGHRISLMEGEFRNPGALPAAEFDYVILDGAPCTRISRISRLLPQVDAVMFVVRRDYGQAYLIQRALTSLADYGAPLLGTVLNGVPPKS